MDADGPDILHLAAGAESPHLVRRLLDEGCDPDLRSSDGMTPLHVACAWGRLASVRLLLARGADPFLEDEDGKTPLDLAYENRRDGVVRHLLDFRTDPCTSTLDGIVVRRGDLRVEYGPDDGDSSASEYHSALSGVDALTFTRNEDNLPYSVVHRSAISQTPPHRNYPTKTTLNSDKKCRDPRQSFQVVERYTHRDNSAGVTLLEERAPVSSFLIADEESTLPSRDSSPPRSVDCDTDVLKRELESYGIAHGPITSTTKRVYLKRLYRVKKNPDARPMGRDASKKTYPPELEKTLRDPDRTTDLDRFAALEDRVVKQFDSPESGMRWREGAIKSSFTYLLLDPRITDGLPRRVDAVDRADVWRLFVDSVFYVGKGKRSRPYSHLYQAVAVHRTGRSTSSDDKIQTILDIWAGGRGVVCLHVFQNVIPAEAYTREAAMIDAIGLKNLKNVKSGNYYGLSSGWPARDRRNLGVYLLHRAMLIFLSEGERQLRPADIL